MFRFTRGRRRRHRRSYLRQAYPSPTWDALRRILRRLLRRWFRLEVLS